MIRPSTSSRWTPSTPAEGWDKVFPKDLITLLKYQDHFWGVPVNIHRANVLWYNKKVFDD